MKKSNNRVLIITGVALLAVGLAVASYFLFIKPSTKTADERKNRRRITFTRV